MGLSPQVEITNTSVAVTGTVTNAASENLIGKVGGVSAIVTVTPTLTVHATYATGDYVGTSATPIDFSTAARVNGGSGTIVSATLIDAAAQGIETELWLFDQTVTPPDDSAAWTISDADALKCIGVIKFATTDYYSSAANKVAVKNPVAIGFTCAAADRSIFGCLVTRGSPAYASGDLSIRLQIIQD